MNAVTSDRPVETVFERITGFLGVPIGSEEDALRVIKKGLPVRAYKKADRVLDFPANLIGSDTSMRRRLAENSALSSAESERLVRVLRVLSEAIQLFGDEGRAITWMRRPSPYLKDAAPVSPLELAATDSGARLMENRLRRTAYGML